MTIRAPLLGAAILCAFATLRPGLAGAQVIAREGVQPAERLVAPTGLRLDFAGDGVWRRTARRVADTRLRLRSAGRFTALNLQRGSVAGTAITGTLAVPTILIAFDDTDITALPTPAEIDATYFGEQPPTARPYTVRTLYREMSNAMFEITGFVTEWTRVDRQESYYTDACGNGSNSLNCSTGQFRYGQGYRDALAALDGAVDFGAYDNDGPDGVPNSGDDDGVVDVAQFVQPVLGGECNGPGIWAHKSRLSAVGGAYVTDDPATGSGADITIDSFVVISGVGGLGCDAESLEVSGIGISAHELGHGIGLPDLYDTSLFSEGIGEWGLMGSGIYTSLASPSHMSAWSKDRLGWVTARELTTSGVYTMGPVVTGDTVMIVRIADPNPRGEYLLLEAKHPVGSDTANMLSGGREGPKTGGLLVWHIDSTKVQQSLNANTVNVGAIQGVALIEADGLADLALKTNRGDAGDPFPGAADNTELSFATDPPAQKNTDGGFVGFELAGITRDATSGEVSFDLLFGEPKVVRASDLLATVRVDGVEYQRFADLLDPAQSYELSIDSPQVSEDGRSAFTFVAWSDGGGRTHTVNGADVVDSVVADVDALHRIKVEILGDGSVSSPSVGLDLVNGSLVSAAATVQLVANPDAGQVLDTWRGDTLATGDVIDLVMTRPFDITAWFLPEMLIEDSIPIPGVMGASYVWRLQVSGGTRIYDFALAAGSLPPGLALQTSGAVTGVLTDSGSYPFSVRVTSGGQSREVDLTIEAGEPTLPLGQVLRHLADRPGTPLTIDEARFLDLRGNQDGRLDVADFLAWIESLAIPPNEFIAPTNSGLVERRR